LIKYLITDCDGVLTDGKYYCDTEGKKYLTYSAKDALAVEMLKTSDIKLIMISSTGTPQIHQTRAKSRLL
jgi:3-deoxy-D-manno-octulosonate 8-phosphate phosphatase KdsC-like HAD superfamily phosphatase